MPKKLFPVSSRIPNGELVKVKPFLSLVEGLAFLLNWVCESPSWMDYHGFILHSEVIQKNTDGKVAVPMPEATKAQFHIVNFTNVPLVSLINFAQFITLTTCSTFIEFITK